jgi:hypothetical protein
MLAPDAGDLGRLHLGDGLDETAHSAAAAASLLVREVEFLGLNVEGFHLSSSMCNVAHYGTDRVERGMTTDEPAPTSTLILCPQCLGHGYPPSTLRGFDKPPREACPTCKGRLEVQWPNAALPDPKMVRCDECHARMPVGYHVCIECGTPNPAHVR